MAVLNGTAAKRKLLIVAPPGHAKSTWLSLILPPWYLGNHSDHSLLFFTSSDTMARQFGGTVKSTLEANANHAAVFGTADCRPDTNRGWSTDGLYLAGVPAGSKDPSYRALGYGASVVGARAHGIILDDPLTQEQARSAVEQIKAKQYHDLTIDSRLHPDGWELAIMTRWHDNDLAAHLASKTEWDVLHLPALSDDGGALWPERFNAEWLQAKRADIGGALFNCVYQGDPTALGGEVFKESSWFRPLPDGFTRDGYTIIQFWDVAWSEKQTADYVASATLAVKLNDPDWHLVGISRHRVDKAGLAEHVALQVRLQRPDLVGIEKGAFQQAATKTLLTDVRRLLGHSVSVEGIEAKGDKVSRARVPAAKAEAGMLFCDRAAPWFPEFEAEALGFPLSSHDDQVDALSGASLMAVNHLDTLAQDRTIGAMMRSGIPLRQSVGMPPRQPNPADWMVRR